MSMDASGNEDNAGGKESGAKEETATAGAEATERGGRMNAAKAFLPAMYAGEDVVPDEFGLATKEPRSEVDPAETVPIWSSS